MKVKIDHLIVSTLTPRKATEIELETVFFLIAIHFN